MANTTGTGHAVVDLLSHARSCLGEAAAATTAGERYATAHLAALRTGAAVLAARARRHSGRRSARGRGPRNVWADLAKVAPELREWAEFFGASAAKRAAAQAGVPQAVTSREADDLLRDAEAFCDLVCVLLGLPMLERPVGAVVALAG